MRITVIALATASVLLSGCMTRREALRADRIDARQQTAQCQNAKAYGSRRQQAVQCAQARDARRELRRERNNW